MAYAVIQDVEDRLIGQTITGDEDLETAVRVRLNDAETIIKARISDLDQQIIDGKISEDVVIMVEANAVLRLVRNPEGFIQENDGAYSYALSEKVASGRLDILPEEWALLGVGGGAFTIKPKILWPYYTYPYIWETV